MAERTLLLPVETLNREFDGKLLLALHALERGGTGNHGMACPRAGSLGTSRRVARRRAMIVFLRLFVLWALLVSNSAVVAQGISVGDRVRVNLADSSSTLAIWDIEGAKLGRQPQGAEGTVVAGPVGVRKGIDHWDIDFDWGVDGFSQGNRLAPVASSDVSIDLNSSVSIVSPPQSATLSWLSTNADSCVGQNFDPGGSTAGSVSVSPTTETTYTLDCAGAGGVATDSITIGVSIGGGDGEISVGDRVRVNLGDPSNTLAIWDIGAIKLGRQPHGAVGTVVGGPTLVRNGSDHWDIDFDSGVDGFSQENRLAPGTSPSPDVSDTEMSQRSMTPLTVAWDSHPQSILGFRVFYGPSEDTAIVQISELRVSEGGVNPADPSVTYDPESDLGLQAGDPACFRVSAFTETLESPLSQASCM